jgi:hypothetical protein
MATPGRFGITKEGELLFREVFGDETAEEIINEIDPRPPRPKTFFDYATQMPYPGTLQGLVAEHTRLTGLLRHSDVHVM